MKCGIFSAMENKKQVLQDKEETTLRTQEGNSLTQTISRDLFRSYDPDSRPPTYLLNAIEKLIDGRFSKTTQSKNKELRTDLERLTKLSAKESKHALDLKCNIMQNHVQYYINNCINVEEFTVLLSKMDAISTEDFEKYHEFFDLLAELLKSSNTDDEITPHELIKHGIAEKLWFWLSSNNANVIDYLKSKCLFNEELVYVLLSKIHKLINLKETFTVQKAVKNNSVFPRFHDTSSAPNIQTVKLLLEPVNGPKDRSPDSYLVYMCCVSNFEFVVEYLHTNQHNNLNSNESYLERMIPAVDIDRIETHRNPSFNNIDLPSNVVSYSRIAQKNKDEHTFEFYIEGNLIKDNRISIYKALHLYSKENQSQGFWYCPHQIKFKKVKKTQKDPITHDKNLMWCDPDLKILLQLAKVLHKEFKINQSYFLNEGLNNKISQQFSETVIILSEMIPSWVIGLITEYPFLITFKNKSDYIHVMQFGFIRNIIRSRTYESNDLYSVFYYRLNYRTKALINRNKLFENGTKLIKKYGNSRSILEIQFLDEIGTGTGPTLEFYSHFTKEFRNKTWGMWRNQAIGNYHDDTLGLFPVAYNENDHKINEMFRLLGITTAKAIVDSRLIEIFINPSFILQAIDFNSSGSIELLKSVDLQLAAGLEKILTQANIQFKNISGFEDGTLLIDGVPIEDLCLTFTVPGSQAELIENGSKICVDSRNASDFVRLVIEKVVGKGIMSSVESFAQGFNSIVDIKNFAIYNKRELIQIFGGNINIDEYWTQDSLKSNIKADHGYMIDSKIIENFIAILVGFSPEERRMFVKFVSGSAILPENGFGGLNPNLTIVRKECEHNKDDDYLPSVMTCAHYLKLPNYTNKEIMEYKLKVAMSEGCESFHLS